MAGIAFSSLRDVWYHNLEKFPRKRAVVCEGVSRSYAECDVLSDRLRRGLAERCGLRKGDRVAIAAPNGLEFFTAYWATMKSGGVVAPVNTRLGTEELAALLDRSEAEILVVHAAHRGALMKAAAGCRRMRHVVGIGFAEGTTPSYEALTAEGGGWDHHPPIAEEDVGILLFTSGTTGLPKGAVMRHGDLLFNNRLAIYAHGLEHSDVHLLAIPMFHPTPVYSLLPTAALTGATVALAPRPDVKEIVDLIERERVTTFFGVPSLFRLLDAYSGLEGRDLGSLRLIAYAGSPMPPVVIGRLRQRFPRARLHNFFGLSETISMTHVLPDADADSRPESIGKALPHIRQRILGEDGLDLPPGEVGELHFHRDNIISGYWKEPDLLAASLRGEWFNTGDLALVDPEGYVYLKGRSKDMIKVAGEQVYGVEVENCIMTHEKVMEAAVIGIAATGIRAHLGELVKAVVVARPGMALTEGEVKRHCMERLASYKVPQVVEFRTELPRNAGGKVLKRLLKEG